VGALRDNGEWEDPEVEAVRPVHSVDSEGAEDRGAVRGGKKAVGKVALAAVAECVDTKEGNDVCEGIEVKPRMTCPTSGLAPKECTGGNDTDSSNDCTLSGGCVVTDCASMVGVDL
jgi:hypothetical protein